MHSKHSSCKVGEPTRLLEHAAGALLRGQRGWHLADRGFKTAMALRYQVYCLECSFLSPDDYPDGLESDEHDEAAAHFYTFDQDQELVGYVRLVRPDVAQRLPFQAHCATTVGAAVLPAPSHAAEISRLMLRRDYRRQRGNSNVAVTTVARSPLAAGSLRQDGSHVLMDLYRQMYVFSRSNGIGHWYAAMERPLARTLSRMNFAFRQIGPPSDYYGVVAPYIGDLGEMEAHLEQRNPALMAWMRCTEATDR